MYRVDNVGFSFTMIQIFVILRKIQKAGNHGNAFRNNLLNGSANHNVVLIHSFVIIFLSLTNSHFVNSLLVKSVFIHYACSDFIHDFNESLFEFYPSL